MTITGTLGPNGVIRACIGSIALFPRNVMILFLLTYRKFISPLYGDVCRYYPTCSSYGLGQVQQRGIIVGSVFAAWRILRCNPWSDGGIDKVKPGRNWFQITKYGFVVPKLKKETIKK